MGRKRQEQVTGKTFEERVKDSKGLPRRIIKNISGFFKPKPTRFANVRRDGMTRSKKFGEQIE